MTTAKSAQRKRGAGSSKYSLRLTDVIPPSVGLPVVQPRSRGIGMQLTRRQYTRVTEGGFAS
jgi:hypothetical protein